MTSETEGGERAGQGSRPPNMRDVARAAGVSHQTVSRVLNESTAVRSATRDRVLSAIDRLGYRRNSAARALVTRRSRTFGVITMPATFFGPASTLHAIELAAREAGYFVRVATVSSFEQPSVEQALRWLAEGRHLLEQGAGAPVWHVAGPPDWVESGRRVVGWRQELAAWGVEPLEPLVGTWNPSSGYAAGLHLARRRGVVSVFVANDRMALGLLRAFSEAGVRVPEDVLVAGFDDVPEAAFYSPPLTTVRQDFAAVGRHSIGLLVQQLEGTDVPGLAVLPTQLVVRQSSVAPAGLPSGAHSTRPGSRFSHAP